MLVIAPGLLAGTGLSSANRLSAGAKSPLTGGIKESNSGGTAAFKLARLGVKALMIKGSASAGKLLGIRVSRDGITFEDLAFTAGMGIYPAAEELRKRFGTRIGLILGAAGEMRMSTACLERHRSRGDPPRNLGRGGLGAVAGSKGLKAIIIDDAGGEMQPYDTAATKELMKRFADQLKAHPVTGEKFPKYGTAMTLMGVNGLGGLPTRNFSAGTFEKAESLSGKRSTRQFKPRREFAHNCMPGCVIRCSNKYVDAQGGPVVGSGGLRDHRPPGRQSRPV